MSPNLSNLEMFARGLEGGVMADNRLVFLGYLMLWGIVARKIKLAHKGRRVRGNDLSTRKASSASE